MALTSHVGIDFGNSASVMAITRRGGVDVVCGEASNRTTSTLVSFGPRERLIGESAAGQLVMNAKNTVSDIKRLIGRKFNDPEVQAEIKNLPFKTKALPDGNIGIEVMYKGEPATFTTEQITAMYLGKLKRDIEKEISSRVHDVVISCPGWWNDAQRRALNSAADIAGLHCIRLLNETTATALQYGLFKLEFDEKTPVHVMFIDFGQSQMSVSIVDFTKNKMKVLVTAYDRNLGGRDFDEVLVNHFAAEFKQKYKLDVHTNVRAMLRLRASCERLKKMLSANSEAPLNIESLMNDVDVKGHMKREQFEQMIEPLLERVLLPIKQALEEAKLKPSDFHAIEAIGNAIRVPAVQKKIESLIGRELGKTQNMSESVVKGCALQAAMLSIGARVREYHVQDAFPYPMSLSWGPVNTPPPAQNNMAIIQRLHAYPVHSTITFNEVGPFQVQVDYSDPATLPPGTNTQIGKWTVEAPASTHKQEVKVKAHLSISGLLNIESAQLVETIEIAEAAATAPAATPPASPAPQAGAEAMATEAAPAAPAAAAEPAKKTTTRHVNLTVRAELANAMPKDKVKALTELEAKMTDEDRAFTETAEAKNSLEEYILNMRSKLGSELKAYATDSVRAEFLKQLEAAENWLNDAPEETTKSQYSEKLKALEKTGDPIVGRFKDFTVHVPDAFAALRDTLNAARKLVTSTDAKYEHIDKTERTTLTTDIDAALKWAEDSEALLRSADKLKSPPFTLYEIKNKYETLDNRARGLMSRPKPKEEPKKAAPADGDKKPAAEGEAKKADGPADAGSEKKSEAATGDSAEKKQMDLD